ncbi:MAG: permease [Helicobacter trogontum]|uniref:permease n=1 Tax=Helicobacter trogontum TaxID=50960 RepID=UPI002431ABD2|nr:permease [Helicobacter trogontum]MCI5787269.1 permease [Helicobacter trogontum]
MQSLKLFLIYFIELSMLFVFVSVIVGFINQKYKNTFQKHLSKDSYFSYFKAIFLGSLTPFCSCSTIPLLRALLKANVAFGVCIAYLFTSPLINLSLL